MFAFGRLVTCNVENIGCWDMRRMGLGLYKSIMLSIKRRKKAACDRPNGPCFRGSCLGASYLIYMTRRGLKNEMAL